MASERRLSITRLAMRVHLWAGLVGATVFFLVGTSGSLLVFHAELDRALFPALHEVRADGREVSHQRAVDAARRALPGAYVRGLRPFSATEQEALRLRVEPAGRGGASLVVLVDPYDGEVRAVRPYGAGHTKLTEDPLSWLYLFHYTLTAEKAGQLVVVLASLLLMISVLTGAFVYRKHLLRALTLQERLRTKNVDTLLSSLHRLLGTFSLAMTLLLAVTGFWMLRGTLTEEFWQRPGERAPPPSPLPESPHTFDDALLASERGMPGFTPTFIELKPGPGAEGAPSSVYRVRGRHADDLWLFGDYAASVLLDGGTLGVIDAKRANDQPVGDQLSALAFPLHQGHWGGLPIKLLYVLAGLAVPLLSVTGPLLALRRQRRRQH